MAAARSRAAASCARLLSLRLPLHLAASSPPLPHLLASRIISPRLHFAFSASAKSQQIQTERVVHDLLAELERERHKDRRKEGDLEDGHSDEEEEEEDFLGVKPLIAKLERRKAKEAAAANDSFWQPTDSDSDEDDERYTPDAIKHRVDEFDRKCKRHSELLRSFAEAETLDDAHKWMTKIDKFEERHLKLPLEYRVIGDMMNRLKDSTGKERFVLLQKLNRAVRLMECKEAYDPSNPANFGVIQHQHPHIVACNSGDDDGTSAGKPSPGVLALSSIQ